MRIRTDDEVYRVDAVWLGPPKATFPWRARYVAWGVGTVVFLFVLTVFRQMGISLFWAIAWGLVVTIGITMIICARISHERPLGAVLTMWIRELTAPREVVTGRGGAVSASAIRVHTQRPRRKPRRRDRDALDSAAPPGPHPPRQARPMEVGGVWTPR
ncbi:MAG TPA: hypothetical protein VGX25_09295 [Actinophytocola sp.]|uniref:hypothetical protein n=1 Tax=Actinophytocola sp. TaxID=1872138 RepID=UPI002DDC967F|nr:hypothetical protein [Actinophytocola sp.]HEV2779582.1 hypothetical protein [Actinophytocola sp.]